MENRHEKIEGEIKENLEKIISIYFKEFLNKFDNFNNQMKIVEVLIKAYQYRYDKMKQKFNNINDVIALNYEDQKENLMKLEKLNTIEAKLTQVEVKLHLLNKRIDSVDERIEKNKNN
jgi:hypothetical protein